MRLITVLTLLVLALTHLAAHDRARAGQPRPAACVDFNAAVPERPAEHVPYPPTRKPWPVDVAAAAIVTEPLAAGRTGNLRPVVAEEIREWLKRYFVVPLTEWENGYSHVAGWDAGGWLVAGAQCFRWTVRPGGLGWIVYPDGTAVYLAAELHPRIRAVSLRQTGLVALAHWEARRSQ